MQFDISLLRETFFEEAVEHLLRLESGLLRLEQGSHDKELLNDIFRCVHSIKGGSVVFRHWRRGHSYSRSARCTADL
jgi:two-component system chemotaxis sensor kinase CheA